MTLKELCEKLSDLYNRGYTQNKVIIVMEGDGRKIEIEIGEVNLINNKIVLTD